jgi:hypothetical protein
MATLESVTLHYTGTETQDKYRCGRMMGQDIEPLTVVYFK